MTGIHTNRRIAAVYPLMLCAMIAVSLTAKSQGVWTPMQASEWYARQPWLVGCNFIPSTAINELEMWQAETWDPVTIDRELGWAESIGMNTIRVFLHDLLWKQDPAGFTKRLNEFLALCEKHHIRPMLVLFDSVWDPNPQLGKQREPKPGVHNSGWVQSPGAVALLDEKEYPRLEAYVKGVVAAFAKDNRVLAWDIWNEPYNMNTNIYPEPDKKLAAVQLLLGRSFAWARSVGPTQPLTSGIWRSNYKDPKDLTVIERIQLNESDIISFHNYGDSSSFLQTVHFLQPYNKPLICTEYLARGFKSTFQTILPQGKKYRIAMYNWGLVKGKTQTHLPWDSWEKPYINGREPAVWHHEIFYPDGKPYSEEEVRLFKDLTKR